MGDLVLALLPEMAGLLATPAAVIGCVLLLESRRPLASAGGFAAGFLVQYVVISAAALVGSADRDPAAGGSPLHELLGLGVGVLLLLAGAVALLRPAPQEEVPTWMRRLEDTGPRGAFAAGVVLSLLNPNLVILLSGLGIITAAETTPGVQVLAVGLLLGAFALDFAVPVGLYLVMGERARPVLGATRAWLLRHNRALTVAVLLGFGTLFVARGVRALLG